MARVFTIVYAFSGVAFLGIAIGVLGAKVVEAQETAVRKTSEIAKTRVMSLFASSSFNKNNNDHQENLEQCIEEKLEHAEKELQEEQSRQSWRSIVWQLAQTFGLVVVILVAFAFAIANDPGIDVDYSILDALYFTIISKFLSLVPS